MTEDEQTPGPTPEERAARFSPFKPYARRRPSGALEASRCALCNAETDQVADGKSPAGDLALFVPICAACCPDTPTPAN